MKLRLDYSKPLGKTELIVEDRDKSNPLVKSLLKALRDNPFVKIVKKKKYPLPF